MRRPLISFIIPVRDRVQLLQATLASVFNQTIESWEIILIDDHSQPPIKTQLDNFEKVQIFRLSKNRGPSYARNFGLQKAHGQFICFLDSDDRLMPDFCDRMLQQLRRKPVPVICLTKASFSSGYQFRKKILQSFINLVRNLVLITSYFINRGQLVREAFFAVTLSRLMLPRKILKNIAFNNRMRSCEDWDFVLQLFDRSMIYILPQALVYFHFSKNSLSETGRRANRWQSYDQVIERLPVSAQHHPLVLGFKWYKKLAQIWL